MKHLVFLTLFFFSITAHSQLTGDSVLIEGHYRTFHFIKPVTPLKDGSLLFALHGSGGTGIGVMDGTKKLEAIAPTENLLIVYPDGYKHYWNECRKASTAAANTENINENAFFEAMIHYFNQSYGVDKKKVFVIGTSGGGHMAYKLALTMPSEIKAITAIIANLPDPAYSDCGEMRKAIPVMIINGTDDKTNPYNGGEMFVNNSNFGVVRSTEKTFAYWYSLAGYKGKPVKKILPDTDTADHKIIESYTFRGSHKPEIVLLKVVGGKHDYPGDIDVYLYAWDFFKRQLKNK